MTCDQGKTAIVIGAGPAGLTAALELARRSGIRPIVVEALDDVGGLSRTIEYKGNRMDIGGHRFFSKVDWVMDWWRGLMPVAASTDPSGVSIVPTDDKWLLIRSRLSRIYFLRRFFDYPISLSVRTMTNLGLVRMVRIGLSYLLARAWKRTPERHLEDFFVNRFGGELYRTFFRDYTEKVWGVPCTEISPAWGAQRIKGLSISKAVIHALKKTLLREDRGIGQKSTETSLIERFLYPKHGPGQIWRIAAEEICRRGGQIHFNHRVIGLKVADQRVVEVMTQDRDLNVHSWTGDWVISTMPVRDLIEAIDPPPPAKVRAVASGLVYRDFITIGVLVKKMKPHSEGGAQTDFLPDTWIYIQEPDVKIGRLQIFNNWSPALVSDASRTWLGLEYFCQEGDDLWNLGDDAFARLAIEELARIDLIDASDVEDYHVVRVAKAYPAYFGSYDRFSLIRQWTDSVPNMFLIGRNGMHRYNNQDHSMVTAKLAADSILAGSGDKTAIWAVNVEEQYHEETGQAN